MVSIADDTLGHLGHQGLAVAQGQLLQSARMIQLPPCQVGLEPIGMPTALHDGAMSRGMPAENHRNAYQPVVSGNRQFCRRTVGGGKYQRHNAGRRETEVSRTLSRAIEDLSWFKLDEFEVVNQPFILVVGERRQNEVLFWPIYENHRNRTPLDYCWNCISGK